jgi:hypothetical protein
LCFMLIIRKDTSNWEVSSFFEAKTFLSQIKHNK